MLQQNGMFHLVCRASDRGRLLRVSVRRIGAGFTSNAG